MSSEGQPTLKEAPVAFIRGRPGRGLLSLEEMFFYSSILILVE